MAGIILQEIQGVVLEWLRERFAKPCRVGSIPTHASIFLYFPKTVSCLPAVYFEPDGDMPTENFVENSGNELDKRSKRGYITGYSIEKEYEVLGWRNGRRASLRC